MKQQRKTYTPAQKREYAKLMVDEGYSLAEVQKISGACQSAVSRWKRQYEKELSGVTPVGVSALTPDHSTPDILGGIFKFCRQI
jgi:transposase-like protein